MFSTCGIDLSFSLPILLNIFSSFQVYGDNVMVTRTYTATVRLHLFIDCNELVLFRKSILQWRITMDHRIWWSILVLVAWRRPVSYSWFSGYFDAHLLIFLGLDSENSIRCSLPTTELAQFVISGEGICANYVPQTTTSGVSSTTTIATTTTSGATGSEIWYD